jgi:hypothetical protein
MAFNIYTNEGSIALDRKIGELFTRISAWPSTNIGRYLKDNGWKDCGWDGVQHSWELPAKRSLHQQNRKISQTRAIRYQIYYDIEDQGLIVKSFPLAGK